MMTFASMMELDDCLQIWDTAGLLVMQPKNKANLLRHLCLHSVSNKAIYFEDGKDYSALRARVVKQVIALLEHKQMQLDWMQSHITNLQLQYSSQNVSYSTNSLNDQNKDGYKPLENVQAQSFSRTEYNDFDQIQQVLTLRELELKEVYNYLSRCILPDDIRRVDDISN